MWGTVRRNVGSVSDNGSLTGYRSERSGELLRKECESLTLTAFYLIDLVWSSGVVFCF